MSRRPAKRAATPDIDPVPETRDWAGVLAALRERIERLEAEVRRLQSQGANRA